MQQFSLKCVFQQQMLQAVSNGQHSGLKPAVLEKSNGLDEFQMK